MSTVSHVKPHKCNRETMVVYPHVDGIAWHCCKCGNEGHITGEGVPEATGWRQVNIQKN